MAPCSVLRWLRTFWCSIQGVENFIPKLWEVIRVTKTRIYCQGTECRRCVLAALRPVKVGLTKIGNQAKPLKYSEKKNRTNLEQMFQRRATDLDTQPTTTQQRLMRALKKCQVAAASTIRAIRSSSESIGDV